MRFPYLHTMAVESEGYVAKFHIQKHIDGSRFIFTFDKANAPSYSYGLPLKEAKKIKGLESIGKLAPLHECPVATGEPVRAAWALRAFVLAEYKTESAAHCRYKLRVSQSVLDAILQHCEASVKIGKSIDSVIQQWVWKLAPAWKRQARVAEQFVTGQIQDLTFYPVSVRIKKPAK